MPEEIDKWFEEFWQCYPADLSHRKKGSKSEARKVIDRMKPDEAKRSHIMVCMRELMRYCRQEEKTTGKTDRWPHVVTWLRQERWECIDDISTTELKTRAVVKECACGNEVGWKNICWECYDKTNPESDPRRELRKENLIALGIAQAGDDKRTVVERCRDYLQQKGMLAKTISGKRSPTVK